MGLGTRLYSSVYVGGLLFSFALTTATQPDLDHPGCYRNGWDILRGIYLLEGLFSDIVLSL